MNFQDLLSKLKTIDESMAVMAPPSEPQFDTGGAGASDECAGSNMPPKAAKPGMAGDDEVLIGEKGVDECGGDMGPMGAPRQADNVTMNVSMNGSGAGGIKDLINILKHIEGGAEKDVVVGMDEEHDGGFQSATTEPDTTVADPAMVLRTGRDLASKDLEAPKVNGGGNAMQESLVARLSAMYKEVKSR